MTIARKRHPTKGQVAKALLTKAGEVATLAAKLRRLGFEQYAASVEGAAVTLSDAHAAVAESME